MIFGGFHVPRWRWWFAWRPVWLVDGRTAWLHVIERRQSSTGRGWYYRERGTGGGE